MLAKGYGGSVELLDNKVRIVRSWWRGRGNKEILLEAITSIEIKPCGILQNGYIRFGYAGAIAPRRGFIPGGYDTTDAANDENAMLFTVGQGEAFTDLRRAIEERIAQIKSTPTREGTIVDQLERLADLRSKGILNEEEFQQQKSRLLG